MSSSMRRGVASEVDAKRVVLEATRFSRSAEFAEPQCVMIATAVSELARNILKYAHRGEIRLQQFQDAGRHGIRILAVDQGPGIIDIESALRDHSSSGGTLGLGLPGVRRMMDEFSIESTPGEGTTVEVVKWK